MADRRRVGGRGGLSPLLAVPVGLALVAVACGLALWLGSQAPYALTGPDPWWQRILVTAGAGPLVVGTCVLVGSWGYALVVLPFLRTWSDGPLLVDRGLLLRTRTVDLRTARVRFRQGRTGLLLVLTDPGSGHVVEAPAARGADVPGLARVADVLSQRTEEPDVMAAVALLRRSPRTAGQTVPESLLVDDRGGDGFVMMAQGVVAWTGLVGALLLALDADGWFDLVPAIGGFALGVGFAAGLVQSIRRKRRETSG